MIPPGPKMVALMTSGTPWGRFWLFFHLWGPLVACAVGLVVGLGWSWWVTR